MDLASPTRKGPLQCHKLCSAAVRMQSNCRLRGSLGVGPVRGQGPVDGRRRLHVGPVGEADALHEARAVHVARVAVRVRQADAGVHNDAAEPQALEVVAQQRALRGRTLALLMPPGEQQ